MTTIYVTKTDPAQLPKRRVADHYATEPPLIQAALAQYAPPSAHSILDVGAGDGRWGLAAQAATGAPILDGIDIRPLARPTGFTGWYHANFLTWQPPRRYGLIVSNPPYNIAEALIRRAWAALAPEGTMIMLLRLAFQAGVGRGKALWLEIPPQTVAVCSRRPSFYGGGTNGTDYGVYVWRKDAHGDCVSRPGRWAGELLSYERDRRQPNKT